MTSILAELCLCAHVLWKVALARYKIRRSAEHVSKQIVKGRARSLLRTVINCERREMNWRRNCQAKGPKLSDLKKSQPVYISGNMKAVAKQHLIKRLVWG